MRRFGEKYANKISMRERAWEAPELTQMGGEFLKEEVKAIWDLGAEKALWPDGFPIFFL